MRTVSVNAAATFSRALSPATHTRQGTVPFLSAARRSCLVIGVCVWCNSGVTFPRSQAERAIISCGKAWQPPPAASQPWCVCTQAGSRAIRCITTALWGFVCDWGLCDRPHHLLGGVRKGLRLLREDRSQRLVPHQLREDPSSVGVSVRTVRRGCSRAIMWTRTAAV